MPTNYAKDILGNFSRGMRLAWCTMSPPPPPISHTHTQHAPHRVHADTFLHTHLQCRYAYLHFTLYTLTNLPAHCNVLLLYQPCLAVFWVRYSRCVNNFFSGWGVRRKLWCSFLFFLKLINNSTNYNKGNHNRDGGLEICS